MSRPAALGCGVLVVGGGAAGVAAAVAAARAGADVVLAERHAYLGGKATAANVGTVCGLYHTSRAPAARYLADGFPREFAERLVARSGRGPVSHPLGLHFLPYRPFDFRRVCDELVQAAGVRTYLHTAVARVAADGAIREVQAVCLDRPLCFAPRAVVDCSGEALCLSLAGQPVLTDETYQAPSQVFALEGIADTAEDSLGMAVLRALQQALREGAVAEPLGRVSIVPGSLAAGRADFKINLPLPVDDAPNKASALELAARAAVDTVAALLIARVPALAGAHLAEVAAELGIRTGRRAHGRALLTRADVTGCRKRADSAARGAWPIEKWGAARKPLLELLPADDYYDIPAGCLQSDRLAGLYFGGRHIAADEDAIASARVIGTCLATGHAAGAMAARAAAEAG